MATAPASYDPSYNALNQEQQGGANWVVAGNLNIDTANGGSLTIGGNAVAGGGATFTISQGASTVCIVAIQMPAGPVVLDWWLSDSATGVGLTATTASGAVGAGAAGTDLLVATAKKNTKSLTNSAGLYDLSITDSAKTGFYIVVSCGGFLSVSRQLLTADYGP